MRSTVQSPGVDCHARTATTDNGGLAAELVTRNCKGVWESSLPPNDYYLNRDAYDVTLVSTRVTTLEFKGGFTRRYIDLKVDSKGDFQQSERSASFPKPDDAADNAINTKVEGWEIPQELRAIVQITPENAPIVVAAVGGQKEVDQRIVVPSIRSLVRNVYGGEITVPERQPRRRRSRWRRGRPACSTPSRTARRWNRRSSSAPRPTAAAPASTSRRSGSAKARFRRSYLLARQREQLAGQLRAAYIQEQVAQEQRQQTEQARSTADRQNELVAAQISVKTARTRAAAPAGRRPRRAAVPRRAGRRPDGAGRTCSARTAS